MPAQRAGKGIARPWKGAEQRASMSRPCTGMRWLTGVHHQPHLRLGARRRAQPAPRRFCGPQLGGKFTASARGLLPLRHRGRGPQAASRRRRVGTSYQSSRKPKAGVGFAKQPYGAMWFSERKSPRPASAARAGVDAYKGADLRRIFHPRLISDAVYCVRGRKVPPHKALEGEA